MHSSGPIGPRIASEGLRAADRGILHVVVLDGYAARRIERGVFIGDSSPLTMLILAIGEE